MSRIHICMVSAQPIPNLIPIRMEEHKPDLVILLVSPDMIVEADRIEKAIKSDGIEVNRISVKPYDYISMHKTCEGIVERFADENLILNATGGTKIMALAAMDVFRSKGLPVLYVDTQNKTIHQISPEIRPWKFKNVMDVKTYLSVYGQKVVSSESVIEKTDKYKEVINTLIKNPDKFREAVIDFNRIASRAVKSNKFPHIVKEIETLTSTQAHRELLSLYEKSGLLKKRKRDVVIFRKEGAEFISGGWLEEYVFGVVKSLNPPDALMRVTVKWDKKGKKPPTNEYDVVFIWNNKLYLIECKTKRFMGEDINSSTSDPIYKLDSLKDWAGGVYGEGIFVSYKGLTEDMKERLEANKLKYIEGKDIANLKERLHKWLM